ncbi:MAG: hypothetical protein F6K42_00345 [Leptolyngbya sp. SIO1D8]|nr:hypothetical protein [Leptolyngbya sp. SIO1D8]
MRASIPLPTTLIKPQRLEQFQEVELSLCDHDWLEVTLQGLWITEDPNQEEGVFVTELTPHLEQRLFRLWTLSQTRFYAVAIAHGSYR